MEFEKYQLILAFEEANYPLSVWEKGLLTSFSLGLMAIILDLWEKKYCARRYHHD